MKLKHILPPMKALPLLHHNRWRGRTRYLGIVGISAVVALVVVWQVVHRGMGVGLAVKMPHDLVSAPYVTVQPRVFMAGDRNPFDAAARHWQAELPVAEVAKIENASAPVAVVRAAGFLRLPGLDVAVTEKGLIRTGQPMLGGRLKAIDGDQYVIETETGEEQRVPIALPPRPTLESLNRAKKTPQEKQ